MPVHGEVRCDCLPKGVSVTHSLWGLALTDTDDAVKRLPRGSNTKIHRTYDGLDIMGKRLAPGKHLAKQCVLVIAPLQHRVEQTGQQVKAEQKRQEIHLAMTKVVRQIIALGLEHVGVFVCDLPPPTPRLCNVHRVVSREAMIGETARVRQVFARFGVDDGEVEPMDRHGIVTHVGFQGLL